MEDRKPISIVLLVSGLLSGSIILASGEAVLKYGAFGGLFLALTLPAAYLILLLLTQGMREKTLFGCLSQILSPPHKMGFVLFLFLLWIELMITQVITSGLILKNVFSVSFTGVTLVVLILFSLFSFLGLRWEWEDRWFEFIKLILLFVLAIFLPNYIYLQKGLETVYHNLLHYHPRVLHLDQPGIYVFLAAGIIVMFTRWLVYFPLLEKELANHKKKGLNKLGLASISWSTIVLAFSTMTIVAITEKIRGEYVNEQMILIVKDIASSTIFISVSAIWIYISFSTFYHGIHIMNHLWKEVSIRKNTFMVNGLTILFVGVGVAAIEHFRLSILDLYFLFGFLHVAPGILLAYIYRIGYFKPILWMVPVIGITLSVPLGMIKLSFSWPDIILLESSLTLLTLMFHRFSLFLRQN
ncbi:MAG: hypothetical protein H0Z33_16875 [Bacillaceae bacterium]|nr:hypothetical protein [Bacillaceae bacterium]